MDKPNVNVEERPRASVLAVSGLVVLSAVNAGLSAGLDRLHHLACQGVAERMYRQGETKESLLRKVEGLPVPAQLKDVVRQNVQSLTQEPEAIEVESIVEEV